MTAPKHVAIIMDGNGRWAQARKHNRIFGHSRGAKVARNIIEHATNQKLEYLTLFTFSTENWRRPSAEVSYLMKLLAKQLRKEVQNLIDNNIRFRAMGNLDQLPDITKDIVMEATERTKNNTGMQLTFALSYGGRQEIVDASKRIAQLAKDGLLDPKDLDEGIFHHHMNYSEIPDPDLVIRTSGENRISNFMLWQIAYSELLIVEKHWPDFTTTDFDNALAIYSQRNRRFGHVDTIDAQLN